jgi:2,5-furandicarboxylate decarboxylase 1
MSLQIKPESSSAPTLERNGAEASAQPKSLGAYLDSIRNRREECRTVSREIDPGNFQVTSILEHLDQRREFPAVIFERPLNMHGQPSGFPLVSNLWATRERCAEMLGLPREQSGRELGPRFSAIVNQSVEPLVVSGDQAPVQAHVYEGDRADMWMLPVVKHFEMDLSPVLTMANVMHAPGSDAYNITFVKTFPETGRRGGVTIHSKDMGRMLREWERKGEPIPTISILGHHPAFWLGSLALTRYGTNEYATVGAFLQEPLRLAPSVTWGDKFLVPADAEIIIEGELLPDDLSVVDPFGEVSRLYQPQQLVPTMHVTAITHREGAIMQDVFSGHREHFLMGLIAREGSLFNYLQSTIGNVTAVHLPMSGFGRTVCYIAIDKRDPGQAKRTAVSALAHAASLSVVVIVDSDINVFNEEDVLWAILTYTDPAKDVDYIKNVGHIGDRAMENNRILIDATQPTDVVFPPRLRVPPEAMEAMRIEDWLD